MKYRAEIDGLRAVAVLPVVLFHAGFGLFGGGFVGVDVFFVISGYLITTILVEDIEHKRFSLIDFYERRARRILPALFLVMLVCVPFAWAWMIPSQMKEFSRSLVVVTLFVSNIRFSREGGYFDASADENPLLHTWSLAVEEQFYIIFPVFLFFAWRFGRKQVFWIIVSLAIMSLALCEWGWRTHPTANFYLAPTRAWELLAGSIAAFIVQKRGVQANNSLSLLGLAAIVFSIFVYDESIPFPSIYALVPVVGVVLLVLFAEKKTLAAKILSNRFLVGVGAISYSAYLWHQPLFAFARIRLENRNDEVMLILSLVSFAAAAFSWKFVEAPFRNRDGLSRRYIFALCALVGVAICAFALLISETDYFERKFYSSLNGDLRTLVELVDFAEEENSVFVEKWRYGQCFYGSKLNSFSVYNKDACLRIDSSRKNVLLIGDSHAAHWYPALKKVFPAVNILQATASGCRPLLDTGKSKRCTDLRDFIFDEFLPQNSVDTIILSARWRDDEISDQLVNTLDFLAGFSKEIYVFGPTIEYSESLPLIYLRKLRFADDADMQRAESNLKIDEWIGRESFSLSENIASMVSETPAKYISIVDLVCPNDKCLSLTPEDKLINFDSSHFTLEGAEYLVENMKSSGILAIE